MRLMMERNVALEDKIDAFLQSKVGNVYERSPEDRNIIYQKLVKACKNCPLRWDTKYYPVPGVLNKDSFAVFIGRNPNKGEAKENKILPSEYLPGLYFKKYLSILGLGESEISIINMCNCHGSGNRPPIKSEVFRCSAFKKLEFSVIGNKYKVIFAMGNNALYWLFGDAHPGVLQCIGDVYDVKIRNRMVKVIPILHPSHLAIAPENKDNVYKVLQGSRKIIDAIRTE